MDTAAQATPIHQDQKLPANSYKPTSPAGRLTARKIIAIALPLVLLSLAIPATVFLVRQQQDVRSRAAVVQELPTGIDGRGGSNYRALYNTATINEPDRIQSTLIFVNAVPVPRGQKLELVVRDAQTGAEVVSDDGIGARQAVEHILPTGDYLVQVKEVTENSIYYDGVISLPDQGGTILLRLPDGAATGSFVQNQINYQTLPAIRFYNLTSDKDLGLFAGTLTDYTVVKGIPSSTYRNLTFNSSEYQIFSIGSKLAGLHKRIVNIFNPRRVKTILFALGDENYSYVTAIFIPLPEQLRIPLPSPQTNRLTLDADRSPQWCEGVYTCTLVTPDCPDCGKSCLINTTLCGTNNQIPN